MFTWLDLVLVFIGAFGLGWGLAERANRKSLATLSRRVDALIRLAKQEIQRNNVSK